MSLINIYFVYNKCVYVSVCVWFCGFCFLSLQNMRECARNGTWVFFLWWTNKPWIVWFSFHYSFFEYTFEVLILDKKYFKLKHVPNAKYNDWRERTLNWMERERDTKSENEIREIALRYSDLFVNQKKMACSALASRTINYICFLFLHWIELIFLESSIYWFPLFCCID